MRYQMIRLVALVSSIGAATVPAFGQTAGAVVAQPSTDGKQFRATQDGDWQTTIRMADGTTRVYTYVPGTKIEPRLHVSLARIPGARSFRYEYRVNNGEKARQDVAVFWFNVINPVSLENTPPGWLRMSRPGEGTLILSGPLSEGIPTGVKPGQALDGFVIEGPALPGVVDARARGNTSGAVEVPRGLTSAQYQELTEISKIAAVTFPVIGPAIGAGVGETELTRETLLARLGNHYTSAFTRYNHPCAEQLYDAFNRVYQTKGDDASLKAVAAIADQPTAEPWHRELSQALAFCIKAVADGVVPNNRLVEPGEVGDDD